MVVLGASGLLLVPFLWFMHEPARLNDHGELVTDLDERSDLVRRVGVREALVAQAEQPHDTALRAQRMQELLLLEVADLRDRHVVELGLQPVFEASDINPEDVFGTKFSSLVGDNTAFIIGGGSNNNIYGAQIGGRADWHVLPQLRLLSVGKFMIGGPRHLRVAAVEDLRQWAKA